MKKALIIVLALLFSISVASAAFAYPHNYTVYVNDNSGWVSNGQHGHYWSSDYGSGDYTFDFGGGRHFGYTASRWLDWDRDGAIYYYLDDNGIAHYFFMDPDRAGNWYRYRDHNGNVQYYYHNSWHKAYIVVR
ncbi:hypothetical protein [Desulfotruncus alcoholivorax]|uniref:hypothetical protein n=1 Tax=Desulfotruncus alcoholivorax TaxID=265477 RepID=UPI000400BC47|nr:hypothetical protein [Desulfotruncus alcoholivorax]